MLLALQAVAMQPITTSTIETRARSTLDIGRAVWSDERALIFSMISWWTVRGETSSVMGRFFSDSFRVGTQRGGLITTYCTWDPTYWG